MFGYLSDFPLFYFSGVPCGRVCVIFVYAASASVFWANHASIGLEGKRPSLHGIFLGNFLGTARKAKAKGSGLLGKWWETSEIFLRFISSFALPHLFLRNIREVWEISRERLRKGYIWEGSGFLGNRSEALRFFPPVYFNFCMSVRQTPRQIVRNAQRSLASAYLYDKCPE